MMRTRTPTALEIEAIALSTFGAAPDRQPLSQADSQWRTTSETRGRAPRWLVDATLVVSASLVTLCGSAWLQAANFSAS